MARTTHARHTLPHPVPESRPTYAKFDSLDHRQPIMGAMRSTILHNLKMAVNTKDMYGTLDNI